MLSSNVFSAENIMIVYSSTSVLTRGNAVGGCFIVRDVRDTRKRTIQMYWLKDSSVCVAQRLTTGLLPRL
jgi:hypothetical protein